MRRGAVAGLCHGRRAPDSAPAVVAGAVAVTALALTVLSAVTALG